MRGLTGLAWGGEDSEGLGDRGGLPARAGRARLDRRRASSRACSPARPASCSPCTICPDSGLVGADRGSREKKRGSELPQGDRECAGNTGVRMGQRGAALGQASSPTGSPANGHRTLCHPVRGSAGDGVSGAAGAGSRRDRHGTWAGPSNRSWRSRAGPGHDRGDAEEHLRSVLRHEEEQHPGRPPLWSSRARPQQQRAEDSSRSGQALAAHTRDHASAGRRARAARRRRGFSPF